MKEFNLVLSGGGIRSYAHLGIYKYCFEEEIYFKEITAVSGGALIAPFIFLRKEPTQLIDFFKSAKIHRMLFPFYFVPDKFEFLLFQPSTIKLGKWVENCFTGLELEEIKYSNKLHLMATKNPLCGSKAMYTDMLKITDLKNSIAASCTISGVFKEHRVENCTYIDGGHWNNCPIFYDFENNSLTLLAVNLGYAELFEKREGKISQIIRGFEINSYARVQEDIKRWEFEKCCGKRKELIMVNPTIWNARSLDFNIKDWQLDEIIEAGYKAAKISLLATLQKSPKPIPEPIPAPICLG